MTKSEGGVVVVVVGILAVTALGIFTLMNINEANGKDAAPIITAVIGIIGTLVGAYFGISASQASRERAEDRATAATNQARQTQAALTELAANAIPDSDQARGAVAAARAAV